MSINANELLELMEEILDGDAEYIEEEDSEEEDDWSDEEDDEEDDEDDDEDDQDETMVKAHTVMQDGKKVKIGAHVKHKMSSKQKAALAKNRKLAGKGSAKIKRMKSLNKGRQAGLY
jgi:hypothetical protein